jgi:5-methylthioadenosine/S-adenosylhomocysteine deaminase
MGNQGEKEKADLLIIHGILLCLDQRTAPTINGAVAITGNRIAALGDTEEIKNRFVAPQTIDAHDCLIMPGLINAHTHAAMTLFRGLADDLPLKSWLEEHIFPAERKWVNGEFVYWGTLLACAEMIRSGTTTFGDGYFFEDQAARAALRAGMRGLMAQGILDFPTPDSPSPAEAIRRIKTFIQDYSRSELIRPAIFAHTVYTCSPGLLKECRALADRHGVPLIIHLSESQDEVKEVMNKYGRTPLNYLENLGLLSSPMIACHCVWLTPEEMDLLARRKVRVVHNPESNMKLASGVAPIPDLLARGVAVGLGTDGSASNNNLDLFQEMDFTAKLHKVHLLDPTVMPSRTVLEMATLGGARVLGMEKEIGSLETGKKADVIVLELNRPHLQPVYNPVSHLVYSATGADVRDVIIDGKLVMKNRRLLTLDEEEILKRAKEWGRRISTKFQMRLRVARS